MRGSQLAGKMADEKTCHQHRHLTRSCSWQVTCRDSTTTFPNSRQIIIVTLIHRTPSGLSWLCTWTVLGPEGIRACGEYSFNDIRGAEQSGDQLHEASPTASVSILICSHVSFGLRQGPYFAYLRGVPQVGRGVYNGMLLVGHQSSVFRRIKYRNVRDA